MSAPSLLQGLDEMSGPALKERFVVARKAAAAARADGAVAEAETILASALRAGIRAMAAALAAAEEARPLPVPPAPRRTLADLPAAVATGAARNAARPSPMRRIPAPTRPAHDDAAPAAAAPGAPVAAAAAAPATVPAGPAGPVPARPAPAPAPRPRAGGLAGLRRAPTEDGPPEQPEASPARPRLEPTAGPPVPVFVPRMPPDEAGLDPQELRAFRARERSPTAVPHRNPDGSPNWRLRAIDPADDEIPF